MARRIALRARDLDPMREEDSEAQLHRKQQLAVALSADAVGLIARCAFVSAGIDHIVLKGRSFARRLYDNDWQRPYNDTDVLVPPIALMSALRALRAAGFHRPDSDFLDLPPHYAQAWIHRQIGGLVDLHWSLPGARAPAQQVWRELWGRKTFLNLAGAPAHVLDDSGIAFLCALHAARHGPRFAKPLTDLQHALERFDYGIWRDAASVANRLGADDAFAGGLVLVPDGVEMAGRLGIAPKRSREIWLKGQTDPQMWQALFLESIRSSGSVRAALSEMLRWTFPPPPAMRARYASARRGSPGLVFAYVRRTVTLPARAIQTVRSWLRARRLARQADARR